MRTPEPAPPVETPLSEDVIHALRYYLGGRRGWLLLAAAAGMAGLALNWSWLVAIGAAPLLIAVLPCVAMCALGLCMSRMAGTSDAPQCDAQNDREAPSEVEISEEAVTEAADAVASSVEEPDFAPAGIDEPQAADVHPEMTEERS